jgi:hypothetical protein
MLLVMQVRVDFALPSLVPPPWCPGHQLPQSPTARSTTGCQQIKISNYRETELASETIFADAEILNEYRQNRNYVDE